MTSDEEQTAVGYTRLSQESDTSIPDQKEEIRYLAAEQDFDLLRIYDDGQRSSGFDAERPEYLEMQATLEENDIDALFVRDRDRLSRDKRERSMLYYDLDEWGVELWTTTDGQRVEFGDDESWLIEMIRNYMDDVLKRREIAKAKRKVNERVENGYWQGRPRWGTEFDDAKEYLAPGENFEDALLAIKLREARDEDGGHAYSYRDIIDETSIPSTSTLKSILDRKEWYLALAREHDVDIPPVLKEVTAGGSE